MTARYRPASRRATRAVSGTWRRRVIADESRHLLEVLGLEVHHRRGAEAVGLLPPGHQGLAEEASDRSRARRAQVARPRGQAEELLGCGERSHWNRSAACRRRNRIGPRGRERVGGHVRSGNFDLGEPGPVRRPQPAVVAPLHPHDRGLAPSVQRPRFRRGRPQRYTMKVSPAGRLDEVGMAGALQGRVRTVSRGQHVHVGVQLIGSGHRARARHRDRVPPARPPFGRDEIVVAAALVRVRRLVRPAACPRR